MRQVLKQKKLAFKKWQKSKLEGDKDEYKLKRREAKMIVAIARKQSTEELYDELETKEGEKRIYRIAKARQREREKTGNIDIIKDKEGKMLFDEDKISLRWAEYFEELLNVENKREELTEMYKVEGPEKWIEVKEVREVMSGMESNKALEVSEVSIDMLRAGGKECLIWMSDLLKAVWVKEKIPEDWRKSLIVPIFKKKGDILECGNYRGIKLLKHGLKILERILDKRIRKVVKIDPKQFGFMPRKSTVDAIFIVRQLLEKRIEGNLVVFCGFVDLEKAYDRVPREVLYWCLRRKGVSEKLVRMVTETYQDCKTAVRTIEGLSREFEIGVGLHQGSAMSPLLFAVIIDVLSEHLRAENLWELLFADDLAIMADSEEQPQDILLKWQECLEKYGLKTNAKKTETMACSKNGEEQVNIGDMHGEELKQVKSFKYLGSPINNKEGCEKEVQARVSVSWMKWREVKTVLNDKRMSTRLEAKIYNTMVRPVMAYGSECWGLKKKDERKLNTTGMRMLRMMLGVTLNDKLRNEEVRRRTTVTTSVVTIVKRSKLRRYGHLQGKNEEEVVRLAWEEPIKGKRSRRRQLKRWKDGLRERLEELGLKEQDAQDRQKWGRGIVATDPQLGDKM